MLDITADNQSTLIHFVEINNQDLDTLKSKYDRETFSSYDNLRTELISILLDPLMGRAYRNGIDETTLFKQLTKQQKVIYALNAFEGQVNNGGIFQFFWNIPDFSFAVEQSIEAINFKDLLDNFIKVKKEFDEKASKINQLMQKDLFNSLKYRVKQFFLKLIGKNNIGLRRTGFEHFIEGNSEMKNTEWFNDYFYQKEKEFHFKLASYILDNINAIALVK